MMTAGRRPPPPPDDGTCRRCLEQEPVIVIRSEALCRECFTKYVQTKVVKRMETFRVRYAEEGQQRYILLPLSLGAGSTTLLHILSKHLKRQAQTTRRTGFGLHVLHIFESAEAHILMDTIKTRYPEHTYSALSLASILKFDPTVRTLFPSSTSEPVVDFNSLISSLSSTSARADVLDILRGRLIVAFAKQHECEAIVYGDSTTRLAERTLAETAKGRGFALPWLVNDGPSSRGIPVYYPMRELLTKEIIAFGDLAEPRLSYLHDDINAVVSSKNATIDSLMQQYFQSAEQEYPSIVANVVRTTGKLKAASVNEVEQQCELCEMPLQGQAPEKSRLCYGCIRSIG